MIRYGADLNIFDNILKLLPYDYALDDETKKCFLSKFFL